MNDSLSGVTRSLVRSFVRTISTEVQFAALCNGYTGFICLELCHVDVDGVGREFWRGKFERPFMGDGNGTVWRTVSWVCYVIIAIGIEILGK